MNENQNKKIKQDNLPTADNVNTYNDIDIFDFDAHRKAKSEVANQASQTSTSKTSPSPTQPFSASAANQKQRRPANTAPRTPSAPRGNIQQQPRTPSGQSAKLNITDIQPDKVVFDSSAKTSRNSNSPLKTEKNKKHRKIKNIKPYEEKTRGANPFAVLSKALIYIAAVLLVSCLAAYFIIVVSNDVFAFVKTEVQIEVMVPEYATLDQIADELHKKQIIKYPKIFVLYTIIRGNDPGEYKAGVYTVSPTQNYDELLSTFVERKTTTMTEVSVTIPEGYTIDDIIKLFVEKHGMGTKEGFVDAIQNGEYDYWFIEDLTNLDPNRKYRLEGYLYPDTYYFYKEWPEEKIINKILSNFYSKFDIKYKHECEKAGMSVDDVVNLASIIQMEAKYTKDYTGVSSVIHNRLNSSYYMYRLDCDATIQYTLPERKEDLTHEDTEIDHPYNTYKNGGLPPGPISNPTLKAIRAALYPDASSYYFFVSDINGNMLYARTLPEHTANIAKVDAEAKAKQN